MVIKLKDCFGRTITMHQSLFNAIVATYHTLIVTAFEGDSVISKKEIISRAHNFKWDTRNPWLYQNLNETFKIPFHFFNTKLDENISSLTGELEFPIYHMGDSFILDLTKEIKKNNLQLSSIIDDVNILIKSIREILITKGFQHHLSITDLKVSAVKTIESSNTIHFHIIIQKDESLGIGFCVFALYLNEEYSADGYIGFKFTS